MPKPNPNETGAEFEADAQFIKEPEKFKAETKEQESSEGKIPGLENQINSRVAELDLIKKGIEQGKGQDIKSPELAAKQEQMVKEIQALEEQKSEWLDQNGIEQLPEGVSVAQGENGWQLKINLTREQAEGMGKEQRRKLIDSWKTRAAENFADAIETDWRSRDAINLPLVLDVIRNNVPLAIEKKSSDFLNGNTDFLPDFVVIHWKVNSFFDTLIGKPNQIRELKIDFAGESEVLAGAEELVKESDEKPNQIPGKENPGKDKLKPAA